MEKVNRVVLRAVSINGERKLVLETQVLSIKCLVSSCILPVVVLHNHTLIHSHLRTWTRVAYFIVPYDYIVVGVVGGLQVLLVLARELTSSLNCRCLCSNSFILILISWF